LPAPACIEEFGMPISVLHKPLLAADNSLVSTYRSAMIEQSVPFSQGSARCKTGSKNVKENRKVRHNNKIALTHRCWVLSDMTASKGLLQAKEIL